MASLFKRPGTSIWQAQFYVLDQSTGELQKVRKSTGESSKKKALVVAIDMERIGNGRMIRDNEQMQTLQSIYSELGHDIARMSLNSATLRKYFSEMTQVLTGEQMEIVTIQGWCEKWLTEKRQDSSKATMARYDGHIRAFLKWLGNDRKDKPLENVTEADIERWKKELFKGGRVGKTVIAYLKDIRAVFSSAVKAGLLTINPVIKVEKIATDDSQDRKPFTGDEVLKLINAAPCNEWKGLILTAAFTGLRLGDASRLKWSSVDLQTKTIELIPEKTKRRKTKVRIPIQPDLLAYFEGVTITDDSPNAAVFPTLAVIRLGSRNGLSQTFTGIMAKAGVSRGKPSRELSTDTVSSKGKGYVIYERGFHSLRHTFTTWLRTAGVTEEDRMALTGHSTRESHSKYSHAEDSVLRNAVSKLQSLNHEKL